MKTLQYLTVIFCLLGLWLLSGCLPTVTVTETRPDGYKKVTETRGGIDGQAFTAGASLAGQVLDHQVHAEK